MVPLFLAHVKHNLRDAEKGFCEFEMWTKLIKIGIAANEEKEERGKKEKENEHFDRFNGMWHKVGNYCEKCHTVNIKYKMVLIWSYWG